VLRCPTCGSDQFLYPDNPNLDSQVTCRQCGAVAAVRDIADHGEALRTAADRVGKALRDTTKRKP
jgi:transcription initiation factor TFIIIB Brf1 subunit/transcription initiation factor TFIIB